jgi:hypothetical protein
MNQCSDARQGDVKIRFLALSRKTCIQSAGRGNLVQGASGEYMGNAALRKKVDLETYSKELVNIISKSVKSI